MQRFVDNITDRDFDMVIQQTLKGKLLQADCDGTNVDPQEFFDRVETHQQALTKQTDGKVMKVEVLSTTMLKFHVKRHLSLFLGVQVLFVIARELMN
jgi:hypothetical protein